MERYKAISTTMSLCRRLEPSPTLQIISRICEELDEINVKSLYHEFHQMDLFASNHMTFRTPTKKYHHLDHFFGSDLFVINMVGYEIMGVDKATLSDHSPVVLSLR